MKEKGGKMFFWSTATTASIGSLYKRGEGVNAAYHNWDRFVETGRRTAAESLPAEFLSQSSRYLSLGFSFIDKM